MYHYNLGNELLLERKNPINPVLDYCSLDYDFINFNNDHWPITIKPEDIEKITDRISEETEDIYRLLGNMEMESDKERWQEQAEREREKEIARGIE